MKWELIEEFLGRHRMREDAQWLDVGCGRGELLSLGAGRFARAVGCDPSREMMQHASAEVVPQESPNELPFADASFDLVTAVCVYHHVPRESRLALAREVGRVLRPGGYFCVMEHNPWNPATQWIVRTTPVDADAVLLRCGETVRLLRDAGFEFEERSYFLFLPERLHTRWPGVARLLQGCCLGGQYAVFARKRLL